MHALDVLTEVSFHGTAYGGWPIVDGLLSGSSIVYSFGVGADVSFDLALIERYGCDVHAFDPTPRSGDWLRRQSLPGGFYFHAIGVSDEDGTAEFFAPANSHHVSFSKSPRLFRRQERIEAEVRKIQTIMQLLGHAQVDLLKMDIEGFEYSVIANLLNSTRIRPRLILVEYHHGRLIGGHHKTRSSVSLLQANGYKIFFISDVGREYGFVRAAMADGD